MRTILTAFEERARLHPERVAFAWLPDELGAGGSLTWGGWAEAAGKTAAALRASGHRPGDRVAILAGNRPVWPVGELGVLLAGGVGVGIYPTSAPGQVKQILSDSGAVAVLVDTAEQLAKVEAARGDCPALRTVVRLPGGPDGPEWTAWLRRPAGPAAPIDPAADALLIYTSGSTGEPKGARISHACLLASAASIVETLGFREDDTSLSFLPFCHAAERIFGLYSRILSGMEALLVPDHTLIAEAAREYGPTVFGGLPRFYEKAYEAIRTEERSAGPEDRMRWSRVLELGRARSDLRRCGRPVPPELEAEWREMGEPLFAMVRGQFGGRIRLATSGGAAFPLEVAEYLDALGLTVLGAYGLTEHLCVAFNRPDRYTFTSAGPLMPGTSVRIAPDGEILIRRCDLTFSGYHGKPEETREAFTPDGEWLLTGDLGDLDARGLLRVTGRKKELIALSTGKKVAPLPIEARLAAEPWISQAVLYGEGRKFISALLTLRRPLVEAWAVERGIEGAYRELLIDPRLCAEVQAAVDRVNAELSGPERIRRFVVLDRELTAEDDELTPTMKIRRPVVTERYRDRLDALYLHAIA